MPINIEVSDIQIKSLTEFYIQRLRILRDEIQERERETKDINATIQKLRKANQTLAGTNGETAQTSLRADYSEDWPWVKKITFALELMGTALTTKEIVDVLSEYETSFIIDRKRAVASISSTLSTKSGSGKEFIRTQRESGDFAYYIHNQGTEIAKSEPVDDDLDLSF